MYNGKAWNTLSVLALAYLFIPLFLFLLFWFNFPYNIGFVTLTGLGIWQAFKQHQSITPTEFDDGYRITRLGFLTVVYVVAIITLVVGIGGYTPQSEDYEKHKFMLHSLTKLAWPPAYQYIDGTTVTPVYFLAEYMVPALIGRLFDNSAVLNLAIWGWEAIGLSLGMLLWLRYFKLPAWAAIVFWGMGGWSFFGNLILHPSYYPLYMSLWAAPLRCSPPLEMSAWAPSYLFPILIVLPLTFRALDNMKLSLASLWIAGTLFWNPFIGVALAFFYLWKLFQQKLWAQVLAPANFAILIGVVLPLAAYFGCKVFPEKMIFLGGFPEFWNNYPLFILMEFGLWFMLLSRHEWKAGPAWPTLIATMIFPFWCMGAGFDWCFRCCSVFQIILFGMVLRSLVQNPRWYRGLGFGLVYGISLLMVVVNLLLVRYKGPMLPAHDSCVAYPPNSMLEPVSEVPDHYFRTLTPITRQYVGAFNTNILAGLLLKRSGSPALLPESLSDAKIILGFIEHGDDPKDTCTFLRFEKGAHLWIYNPDSQHNKELFIDICPIDPCADGRLDICKRPLSDAEAYPAMTKMERLQKHLPRKTTTVSEKTLLNKISVSVPISTPQKLRLAVVLPTGYCEIAFVYWAQKELPFCLGNIQLLPCSSSNPKEIINLR